MPLMHAYERLFECYGPQQWWPAETPFEVMVGAILTQNTAWTNVEKAINNLKDQQLLSCERILLQTEESLAKQLRPSGYFNIKAKRLQNFCRWYLEQGSLKQLSNMDTVQLRQALLTVNGVGPETADDILLYAFSRPVFVIDSYTRRIFSRLGLINSDSSYEQLRVFFEGGVTNEVAIYNEYHALIVVHAKQHCTKKTSCAGCCLRDMCRAAI